MHKVTQISRSLSPSNYLSHLCNLPLSLALSHFLTKNDEQKMWTTQDVPLNSFKKDFKKVFIVAKVFKNIWCLAFSSTCRFIFYLFPDIFYLFSCIVIVFFCVQATCSQYYKLVMIIIYNCNHSVCTTNVS